MKAARRQPLWAFARRALLPALALLAALALWPWQARLSQPLVDTLERLSAPAQAPPGLLWLDIDDPSLEKLKPELGAWPWRRDVYALLVEQLRRAGAQLVVLDVLLADSRDGDAALARELQRPGAPVLLAAAGLPPALPPPAPAPGSAKGASGAAGAEGAEGAAAGLLWAGVVAPAATLGPAAADATRVGLVTTPLDADGRLRRLVPWHQADGRLWPAMPLLMAQKLTPDVRANAAWQPRWPCCAGRVPRLSLAEVWPDVLEGRLAERAGAPVQGRVVVIGSSAVLADRTLTVHGQLAGPEALVLAYAALRDGRVLRPVPGLLQALALAVALMPVIWAAWRGPAALSRVPLLSVLALMALLGGAAALHLGAGLVLLLAAPLVALVLGALLALVQQQRWQHAEQHRLAHERALAAAANEAKSALLANVSHEIRTPLNAVLGVSELLAATPLSALQRRHVAVFQQAGQTLAALIDDLLDLTKIEAGQLELHPEPMALAPLLDEVLALLRPRAEQKGLALVLSTGPELPAAVLADRKRLQQALTNLLANAIKFTAQGRVALSVTSGDKGWLLFEVSDTGIGIAASRIEAIFEPFVQADGSTTRVYGGTGLGLSITRTVAQRMGGEVRVTSQPGVGSRFVLALPLPVVPTPPSAVATVLPLPLSAPTVSAPPAALGPRLAPRLLLAEDNEVNVYVFTGMLDGRGLAIDVAGNGMLALQMLRERAYDIVFMDVQMPGLDGLEVTRRWRRHEAEHGLPRTPVVALTAHGYASDRQRSSEAGCDHHLVKPLAQAELLALLARWLPPLRLGAALPPLGAGRLPASPRPALDEAAALARLGGDEGLMRRVREHAAVFLAGWAQAFRHADAQGQRALAHDLKAVAASVGAEALATAAGDLEAALRERGSADAGAVLEGLAPVVAALTRA